MTGSTKLRARSQASSLRRAAATLYALATAGIMAACAGTQYGAGAGGVTTTTANTGWRTKKVVDKKAPEALMADDGTICRVAPDRFKDTKVGTLVRCNWQ